jgi:hypothetical protein
MADIRAWLSPSQSNNNSHPSQDAPPKRRRRVLDSDSSDHRRNVNVAAADSAVQVVVESSSSDDMYILQPARAVPTETLQHGNVRQRPVARQPETTLPRTQNVRQPVQQTPTINGVRPRPRSARIQTPVNRSSLQTPAEAEECDDATSEESCEESGTDAQELYRSCILGVRSRPTALRQVQYNCVTQYVYFMTLPIAAQSRNHAVCDVCSFREICRALPVSAKAQNRIYYITRINHSRRNPLQCNVMVLKTMHTRFFIGLAELQVLSRELSDALTT